MSFFESFTPTCPTCDGEIAEEDTNPAKDVAFCRACNLVHSLASLVNRVELLHDVDLTKPPNGVWIAKQGKEHILTASTRSIVGALGALGFGLFWNGIVSVFVLIALSASLTHLGVDLPEWFPAPGMNDEPMSVGMTIFMWVFLTPFILVGTGAIGMFLMCVFGKSQVRIRTQEGTVFTGVGLIGWTRRFTPANVKDVRIIEKVARHSDDSDHITIGIEMDDGKIIKFAKSLPEERRRYMAAILHKTLLS